MIASHWARSEGSSRMAIEPASTARRWNARAVKKGVRPSRPVPNMVIPRTAGISSSTATKAEKAKPQKRAPAQTADRSAGSRPATSQMPRQRIYVPTKAYAGIVRP
jgi:hypothetical protein